MHTRTSAKPNPKKILIIEDEADMCLLLNVLLQGKETSVDHVKSLAAAEEYLQNEHPALILLDNRLPDGFGIDFLTSLKNKFPAIKIIMISGFDRSATDLALENGADGFLTKPFTKAQLWDSVKELLN